MSNYLITDTLMSDIADAIRAKTGGSSPIQGSDFPTAIANIPELLTLTYANKTNVPNTHNIIIRDWNFDGGVLPGNVCYTLGSGTTTVYAVNRHVRNFTVNNGLLPDYAFTGSKILDIGSSLPSGVTDIGASAFTEAYSSDSVYDDEGNAISASPITSLPSGLLTIGASAFQKCPSLALSTLPSSVTTIATNAFRESGVAFSNIPDSVLNISSSAFMSCSGITEMKLSRGMSRLTTAFTSCGNLRKIFIPNNITRVDAYALQNCSSLAHIYCEASAAGSNWNANWNSNIGASPSIHWGATEAQYDAA